MKGALLAALRLYKRHISPQLPPACRYTPTCSEYAMEAIERHGALRGALLAAKRVLSCNPLSRGGYDPVPGTGTREALR
jgi:putative membrane protein insertion efficiency factor